MKTIEDKSAEMLKRWNELHPASTPFSVDLKDVPVTAPETPKSFDLVKSGSGTNAVELLYNKLAAWGKKIDLPPEERLREPITWVGKIAVGESKDYAGWWDVILPPPERGVSISFFGPLAKLRAIEQAERLKDQYQ